MMKTHISKARIFATVCLVLAAIAILYRCPFYNLLGVPCPGCNMTRALLFAVQLDFSRAFFHHPLFFIPVVFAGLWVAGLITGNWRLFSDKRLLYITLGLFLCVYVVRMVLFFPHSPPMEYNDGAVLARIMKHVGVW